MRFRLLKKIILISVAILFAALMIFYAFVLVYDRTGRFTVSVKNPEEYFNITLSESPEFYTTSAILMNDNHVKITNIDGEKDLPKNIDNIDGEHNGENYLAYTFYCKNLRSSHCAMVYEINYNNVTNGIDEAIRVRLYVDGEKTDYAKTRSDGLGKEQSSCDKEFANVGTVCYGVVADVPADGIVKFTVVIWLEGPDKDCNNSIINGSIKFSMDITAQDPEQ